jgi:hypothetical protein
MAVALWIMSPAFRSPTSLLLIGLEASALGLVAAGQTFVILTGGIDLWPSTRSLLRRHRGHHHRRHERHGGQPRRLPPAGHPSGHGTRRGHRRRPGVPITAFREPVSSRWATILRICPGARAGGTTSRRMTCWFF